MQTSHETSLNLKLEQVATILRVASWVSFVLQIGLASLASVLLLLAISGRSFNQAIAPSVRVPNVGIAPTQTTTPGLGIAIFWAVCGILVLLFGSYLAFRLIRFSKRLGNSNPAIHPKRAKVMQVLRLGVITGLVGMLLMILGMGATVGVLLSKSIAQPQGVAIYDPNRIIRSLDVFVAAANTTGLTAHFVGVVVSLGVFNWLHRP
ncbi:DUF3611 family protein [Leptolyngbyaceae cyanobacterium UHCC 1019]